MQIVRDVIGSQKLIPCTLIILVYFCFNSVSDIAYTCYSTKRLQGTNCLLDCLPMSLYKYFKRVGMYISA